MAITRLSKLPAISSGKSGGSVSPCECGCGGTTKSRFVPGHDSILKGLVLRVLLGKVTLEDLVKVHGAAPGQIDAIKREIKARSLPGIKWAEFPASAPAKSA